MHTVTDDMIPAQGSTIQSEIIAAVDVTAEDLNDLFRGKIRDWPIKASWRLCQIAEAFLPQYCSEVIQKSTPVTTPNFQHDERGRNPDKHPVTSIVRRGGVGFGVAENERTRISASHLINPGWRE